MKGLPIAIGLIALLCAVPPVATAQQVAAAPAVSTNSAVPSLINYTGVLKDATGHTLTGVSGVTFLLYKEEQGGVSTVAGNPERNSRQAGPLHRAIGRGQCYRDPGRLVCKRRAALAGRADRE